MAQLVECPNTVLSSNLALRIKSSSPVLDSTLAVAPTLARRKKERKKER